MSKYKKIDQYEHILLRPHMYIGSTEEETDEIYQAKEIEGNLTIVKETIKFVPGFHKLFDEIFTNALDHVIRTENKVKNIYVNINDNKITVKNDGPGIPIDKNNSEKIYNPELLFGNLLTSENYHDDNRIVGGLNGLGSSLVNIFSKSFEINCSDGKKHYQQTFSNNMLNKTTPTIKAHKKSYTEITFEPDLAKFGMTEISETDINIILKRCIDGAIYCKSTNVFFNDKLINIKDIKNILQKELLFNVQINTNVELYLSTSSSDIFEQLSIVNGISTYKGGTHVNYVTNVLVKDIYTELTKKYKKLSFKPNDIKNKLFIFLVSKIPNPTFTSQTKEQLTNIINKDNIGEIEFPSSFIGKIMKSEIVQSILEAIELKEALELQKLQKNNKKVKIEKLVDANSKDRSKCQIFIFEGDSASSSARIFRDPQLQGFFLLKGKFANVSKMSMKDILNTKEVVGLMSSIGLELNTPVDFKNIRYNEILISCDADFDGHAITALLINFFASQWKELFDRGMIYNVLTPLVVITKAKKTISFYKEEEWDEYQNNNSLTGWDISFKKGLGSLSSNQYKELMETPKKMKLTWDNTSKDLLDAWFGENTELRKKMLHNV